MSRVRAEISALTEADLLAAAGLIPVKQARADLEAGAIPTGEAEDPLAITWADATTTFPEGGLPAATCTCPARRTCRHRVRSALWIKAHGAPEPVLERSFLTAEQLRAEVGGPSFARASRALAEGLEIEGGAEEGVWTLLGQRVRLVAGAPLSASICGCGSRELCQHRVIAALAQAGGPEDLFEIEIFELEQIEQEAAALLALGLDGIPPERAERLDALAQERLVSLPACAADLEATAALIRRYHRRSARFSASAWARALGRLLARVRALASPLPSAELRLLRGVTRRAPLPAPPLELLALGAEAHVGEGGTILRLWCCDADTGALRSVSVGRSATEQGAVDPELLWRAPLWGATPETLCGRRIRLSRGRISPDGVLSAAGEATAAIHPGPLRAEDLPGPRVVRGVSALNAAVTLPAVLRAPDQGSTVVLALAERAFPDEARFHEASQTLHRSLVLAEGGKIHLSARAGPGGDLLLRALATADRWRSRATHLLARVSPGARGWEATPISAWLLGDPGPVSLGLSPGPGAPSGVPLIAGAPPVIDADPAREAVDRALDLLEGLSVEGRIRGGRTDALQDAAGALSQLELHSGAAALHALAKALGEGPDRTLGRAWLAALAWTLDVQERLWTEAPAG